MAKHVQKNDLTGTWNIDTTGDEWILAKSAKITTSGTEAIDLGPALTGNNIKINGNISVSGLVTQAIYLGAENTDVYIDKNVVIDASTVNVGIKMDAEDVYVQNWGTIHASMTGIYGVSGTTAMNLGTITADVGMAAGEGGVTFGNAGKVVGDNYGIDAMASEFTFLNGENALVKGGIIAVNLAGEGASEILNYGVIKGPTAISDGEGDAHVTNQGTIKGEVFLGAGDDTFDTRLGTVQGTIHGGEGEDLYTVSNQSVKISELFDEGIDEVRSTVSYTLGDNLENLTLIGKNNTNATGNEVANTIYGNAGDNVLKGLAGSDYLASGAGDDIMIGGADDDVFEFNPKNGHDTIKDFEDGTDMIFSNFIQTQEDVQDMLDNHATETNGGVLIEYGKNSMFIKGMDLEHLSADDFILGF